MQSYLDLLDDVLANGEGHDDRTGVGTRSVFGRQWRHKMADGFPRLTTKPVSLRWVFEELRWILSGSTNERDLAAQGVDIWKEWRGEDGELGPVYGAQWRCRETVRYVKRNQIPKPSVQSIPRVCEPLEPAMPDGDEHIGNTYKSNEHGEFLVLSSSMIASGDRDRRVYRIQFLNTGFVSENVGGQAIRSGAVRDPYFPAFCGIACMGCLNGVTDGEKHPLLETWKGMIKRCYDTGHQAYGNYGGAGVWVCDRWLVFSSFAEDFKSTEDWELKAEYPSEYSLDKDDSGSNVYSVSTCRWASKKEQSINQAGAVIHIATSPVGAESEFASAKWFADKNGLTKPCILGCIRGRQSHHKGWTFRSTTVPEGSDAKYRMVDQIRNVMAQLNQSPNSRRLIVDAWNPMDGGKMALCPCHTLWQLKVHEDNSLSLHLYARSIDIFLGLPFNIASYGLLLLMIAKASGRTANELIISFGDLHLYNNAVEAAKIQLQRMPMKLPAVHVCPRHQTGSSLEQLLSYTWADIECTDYNPQPKLPVAVAV